MPPHPGLRLADGVIPSTPRTPGTGLIPTDLGRPAHAHHFSPPSRRCPTREPLGTAPPEIPLGQSIILDGYHHARLLGRQDHGREKFFRPRWHATVAPITAFVTTSYTEVGNALDRMVRCLPPVHPIAAVQSGFLATIRTIRVRPSRSAW